MHAGAFTTRHNNITNLVADAARSVGLPVELECAVSKPTSATNSINLQNTNKRVDVSVAGVANANIIHADSTVASHRQRDVNVAIACSRLALSAANKAVTTKKTHFDGHFFENETLYPLAAETSGAIHNNFAQYFSLLATRTNNKAPAEANWTTPSFTSFWMTTTSTILRKENARAVLKLAREARRLAGEADEDLPAMDVGGHRL